MKHETSGSPTSSRRKFLKYGAGFGAALAWPNSTVIGANEDIRVGVIGTNGRGRHHLNAFSRMDGSVFFCRTVRQGQALGCGF